MNAVEKNARQLKVGDEIFINNTATFIVENMKPSALSGWGAPVIIGRYTGSKTGPGEIDLSANEKLTDHIFTVVIR